MQKNFNYAALYAILGLLCEIARSHNIRGPALKVELIRDLKTLEFRCSLKVSTSLGFENFNSKVYFSNLYTAKGYESVNLPQSLFPFKPFYKVASYFKE